jgi:hypothetical protein
LEYSNVDGRIILKWNLTNRICGYVLNAWGSRIASGLFWTRPWTFRSSKMQGISWLAKEMLASQGFCSMNLVTAQNFAAMLLSVTLFYQQYSSQRGVTEGFRNDSSSPLNIYHDTPLVSHWSNQHKQV